MKYLPEKNDLPSQPGTNTPRLTVSRKDSRVLENALSHWQRTGELTSDQVARLGNTLNVSTFDWKRAAQYAFWVAIVCLLISLSALLADEWLINLLTQLFHAPDSAKCIGLTLLAGAAFRWGLVRRERQPEKAYSNEAFFFLGVVLIAMAIAYLGKVLDNGSGHFSLLILFAAIIYGVLGLWFPSTLVWIFSLVSLGGWFGAETGYVSGWGAYYLGMNYPLRFVLFGIVLTIALPYGFQQWPQRKSFLSPTRAVGLLYLFIALWILSIFGNYSDLDVWQRAKPIELLHWSLLFAGAAIACIVHGVRFDDGMTRGFGLTFLFINLYTRYFEYFWDSTHKAIFFGLLGLSFWYLGSKAERLWQMRLPWDKHE